MIVQSWHEDGDGRRPTKSDGDDVGDSADVVAQVEDDGASESGMIVNDGIFEIDKGNFFVSSDGLIGLTATQPIENDAS